MFDLKIKNWCEQSVSKAKAQIFRLAYFNSLVHSLGGGNETVLG